MTVWKNDLVTASIDQQSFYEVFHPANIKSTSASPHKGELNMLILNRRRSNIVSTSPTVLPNEAGVIPKKDSLPSICQYRSEIDETPVRHLDIISTFAEVGRYPGRDPLLQCY